MRVVVTGHKGFIGQHVARALKAQGYDVLGLDLPEVDITQRLERVPNLHGVIHLAALAHPRQCDENPRLAYEVNVLGTRNVLQMALEGGARKVVFSSSAHVYDIPPRVIPSDETLPLRLNNIYTTTKILGEQLCHLYWENHGLPYTVLRLFNVYGPGQRVGYFIPDMIEKAKTGAIDLTGGNTTKDFVYIEDVARAFVMALGSNFVGAVNIGTGIETDLASIASRIADEHRAHFFTTPSRNATRMCAEIARAKRVLGWEPQVSLKGGLDAILGGYKAEVSI